MKLSSQHPFIFSMCFISMQPLQMIVGYIKTFSDKYTMCFAIALHVLALQTTLVFPQVTPVSMFWTDDPLTDISVCYLRNETLLPNLQKVLGISISGKSLDFLFHQGSNTNWSIFPSSFRGALWDSTTFSSGMCSVVLEGGGWFSRRAYILIVSFMVKIYGALSCHLLTMTRILNITNSGVIYDYFTLACEPKFSN